MAVSRVVRRYLDIIEKEGASIIDILPGGRHHKVRYTFDGKTTFITSLPKGSKEPTDRNLLNFRADVRKAKSTQ